MRHGVWSKFKWKKSMHRQNVSAPPLLICLLELLNLTLCSVPNVSFFLQGKRGLLKVISKHTMFDSTVADEHYACTMQTFSVCKSEGQ